MDNDKSTWLFIASLIGLAVCAAAALLMLPALTRDGDQGHLQLLASLAVVGGFLRGRDPEVAPSRARRGQRVTAQAG